VCSRRLLGLWRDRRGTSALEFAIIAPAFLAMLFGVFELGWALHCNQSVDYATNVAARGLIADPSLSQSQLQAQVQGLLTTVADPTNVTVSLTEDAATASPRLAHVSVAYTHVLAAPFTSSLKYTYNASSTVTLAP
jgi:Flp pilus assembly protein TadG